LIVVCIILVAGLGITSGALIEMNKVGTAPVINNSSVSQSVNPTSNNVPVSNGVIYFQ
jgi:thiazole synthase ThiGH ThiG subunit